MRPIAAFILVWLVTGAGAVAGSIPGSAIGKTGLFAGAVLGGTTFAFLSARASAWLKWLPGAAARDAARGAVVGFLLAVPIAALSLRTPVIPVLSCALAGVGAIVGSLREPTNNT